MHYLIVILIIALIIFLQIRSFIDTKKKSIDFSMIFPSKKNEYILRKETLIENICLIKDKEISDIKLKKDKVISNIYKEISYVKEANEELLKKKLFIEDINRFVNVDGNFKPYKIEEARNLIVARLNNSLLERQEEYDRKIDSIQYEKSNAISIANKEDGISISYENNTLKTIVNSINDYLNNNKTVSDFHLMKDIVDRNCDAKEEEINTQIPIPLYLGLVGTMAGILIGVGILAFGNGLSALLNVEIPKTFLNHYPNGTNIETINKAWSAEGVKGVISLMGGVAIAMSSSILGILLTKKKKKKLRIAKLNVESNKHTFLSWIQVNLLPTLSDNVLGAVREMTGNLENFNKEFSKNTGNLGTSLEKVNESYKMQVELLDSVRKIADKDLTYQNLQLYTALKNSTAEIGTLGEYLQNTNEYLANVRKLNENLGLQENRTRTIEEVGEFFKIELQQIEARKGTIAKSVGKVDDYLQQALEKLKEHTNSSLVELQKSSIKQHDILQQKTEEINNIVSELKNLTEVKKAIVGFENAIKSQNLKIDNLVNSIHILAKAKSEGTNISNIDLKPKMSMKIKVLIWSGTVLGSIILLSLIIANWGNIFYFLNYIFKI